MQSANIVPPWETQSSEPFTGQGDSYLMTCELDLDGTVRSMSPSMLKRFDLLVKVTQWEGVSEPAWRRFATRLYNTGRWVRWRQDFRGSQLLCELGPSGKGLKLVAIDLSVVLGALMVLLVRPRSGVIEVMLGTYDVISSFV